jgi:hypothetical protein
MGEYDEIALAFIMGKTLKEKLSQRPESQMAHTDRVRMLKNVLTYHLAEEVTDDGVMYENLSADLCRATLMSLYNEDAELGGVGWRTAVNTGEKVWEEINNSENSWM